MKHRELTTYGWTIRDHVRAERIRTDRAMARMVIFDEVNTDPWNGALTPGIAAGADITADARPAGARSSDGSGARP
jgi:hypothetical protein